MTHAPGNLLTPVPRERGALRGGAAAAPTNTYCATCLRTRRFVDRSTHYSCETCSRRLDKVVSGRRNAG